MKFLKLKITRIISIVFLVLLVSLSLSATSLMNFPAFYHHNSQERIITVLISMVVLSVPVIYILKSLIFPNLIGFKKVKNIIFIVQIITGQSLKPKILKFVSTRMMQHQISVFVN